MNRISDENVKEDIGERPGKAKVTQSLNSILQLNRGKKNYKEQHIKEGLELCRNDPPITTVLIPNFLKKKQETRPLPENENGLLLYYHCSSMSRYWFRKHSNLDEILDLHYDMLDENNREDTKEKHVGQLIRYLISNLNQRQRIPYSNFKFNSFEDEAIGKELLMYPDIKTPEDLAAYTTFMRSMEITLIKDNTEEHPIQESIRSFNEHLRRNSLYGTSSSDTNNAMSKCYKENNLTKPVEWKELSREKIYEVSNYEALEYKLIKEQNIPFEEWESFKNASFEKWYKDETHRTNFGSIRFIPGYELITNNVYDDRHEGISKDSETFYKLTNALDLLKNHPTHTQESFFKLYLEKSEQGLRRRDPFNRLTYFKNRLPSEPLLPPPPPPRQKPSTQTSKKRERVMQQPPTVNKYKGMSRQDYIKFYYLTPPDVHENLALAMTAMMRSNIFIEKAYEVLVMRHEEEIVNNWAEHKEVILANFFIRNLEIDSHRVIKIVCDEERMDNLMYNLLDKLEEEIEERRLQERKAQKQALQNPQQQKQQDSSSVQLSAEIARLNLEMSTTTSLQSVGSSFPRSAPGFAIPSPNASENNDVLPAHIKTEKNVPPANINDSDCICDGSYREEIINISSDEEEILPSDNIENNIERILGMIGEGSQNVESQGSLQSGNSTFNAFQPRGAVYANTDQAKNKTPRVFKTPAKRTVRSQKATRNIYLDETLSEDLEAGNFKLDDEICLNLNDDLSFLLSSKLNVYQEVGETMMSDQIEKNPLKILSSNFKEFSSEFQTASDCEITSVTYEKSSNLKIFVDLRQFHLKDCFIEDDVDIMNFLQIEEHEMESLKNMLELIGKYKFDRNKSQGHFESNNPIQSMIDNFFFAFPRLHFFNFFLDSSSRKRLRIPKIIK